MKVLFVTTGHISSNPRLVKELLALKALKGSEQSKFYVLYVRTLPLLVPHDLMIEKTFGAANFFHVDYYDCTFFYKLYLKFQEKIFKNNRITILLSKLLKKHINFNIDLIVSHNFYSFDVALDVFFKHKTKLLIDIEDYHPGEIDDIKESIFRKHKFLNILPHASLVTYASPLIGEQVKELLGSKMPSSLLINNNFPSSEFSIPQTQTDKIRFVWFSQTISFKRGLELIISALKNFKDSVELILIGNLDKTFEHEWVLPYNDFIVINPTLTQFKLHQSLSTFDIGLAIEQNSSDFNRQICLTNKIWAYLQAGLYILATDTPAQVNFINEYQEHGILIEQTMESTIIGLQHIISNIKEIRQKAQKRYEIAKMYSWDYEQKKWLSIVQQVIKA